MPPSADARVIRKLVDRYQLDVGGVKFWAPYWVNNPKLMGSAALPEGVKGAFKGKGTPRQLALSLRRVLSGSSVPPQSADGYRQLMRAHGVGIDCSGFVYYVLAGWMRASGRRPLAQQLVVSREDVIKAMRESASWKRRQVPEAEVREWPALVPLARVCQRFHKDPRMLTAVATLVHPQVVVPVKRAQDVRPGDLIKFTSKQWGDHIALVAEVTATELVIAESTEPEDKLGGVGYSRLQISNPGGGLEDQIGWVRSENYHPGGASRDGIWRLKEVVNG